MIDIELYKQYCKTDNFGIIIYFDNLESTNNKALALSQTNAENGTVVITDNQTSGRGRRSNKWYSIPEKSLTFSIILNPNCDITNINKYSILAGLAVTDTLIDIGLIPFLKWPNDVLIDNKKICGILCESKLSGNKVRSVVIGIGLNVNELKSDFLHELHLICTSIYIEQKKTQIRELILASIVNNLYERLANIESFGVHIQDWIERCGHLDQKVSFNYNNIRIKGEFVGLTELGEARIVIEGKEQIFNSGELVMP